MTTVVNTTHSGEVVGYLQQLLGSPGNPSTSYTAKQLLCNDQFSITLYDRSDAHLNTDPLTKYSVVYVTFKTEQFDTKLYNECLKIFVNMLMVIKCRYYMVVDTFQMTMHNKQKLLGMTKAFADVNKAMLTYHKERLLCTVVVISSPYVKNFINSVLGMFYKPLRPLMFITDLTEFTNFVTSITNIDTEIYEGKHDSAQIQV